MNYFVYQLAVVQSIVESKGYANESQNTSFQLRVQENVK